MNPYVLLGISIACEVVGTTAMKLSEGFTHLPFTLLTLVTYVAAFGIFTIVLKRLPLGLAYGVWGGVGTVCTTAIGIVVWGDPFSALTAVGIALVIGGIALLNQGTQEIEAKRRFNEMRSGGSQSDPEQ